MILKFFELKKKKLDNNNFFLLYGNNKGLIEETIKKDFKPIFSKNVYFYEESDITNEPEHFKETIFNKSFFENDKLVIISRVSDKILNTIEEIIENKISDLSIILTAGILEKKSKIRNYFEKNKNTICVPFYEDNKQTLNLLAQNFLKSKKINLSNQNVNLIVDRCNGDRINLYNELSKIESLSNSKKLIETGDVIKLTNLSENYSISELVDNTLAKNKKTTIKILNENNFGQEDCVTILRTFLYKLKRLFKIQLQAIEHNQNIESIITSYKPPIFWKDKDIIKIQFKNLNYQDIKKLIAKTNSIEHQIKKYPTISINILTNFILETGVNTNN